MIREENQGVDDFPAFDIEDWEEIAPKIDFCFKDEKLRRQWKRARKKRFLMLKEVLGNRMRRSICYGLKGKKNKKHWENIVGYTVDDLIKRLKKTLPKGVTWDIFMENRRDYHIDHIIPQSAFNYETTGDMDFKRCWALSNLQILPASENISKMTKIDKPFQPCLFLRPWL